MQATSFRDDPDFKASPARAVLRRVLWRIHWKVLPSRPLVLRKWWRGMQIMLPNSGAAAQVYYRKFSSPQILQTMTEHLRDGMVVLDLGAHAGEYTLITGALVRPSGAVFAFEPQPQLAAIIRGNVQRNRFSHVQVVECAIGNYTGNIGFVTDTRSMGGVDGRPRPNCDARAVFYARRFSEPGRHPAGFH